MLFSNSNFLIRSETLNVMDFRQSDNLEGIANFSCIVGRVGLSNLTQMLLESVFLRVKPLQFATSFGGLVVFGYQDSCS